MCVTSRPIWLNFFDFDSQPLYHLLTAAYQECSVVHGHCFRVNKQVRVCAQVREDQLFTHMGLRLSVVYRYGLETISCLQIWVWDYQLFTDMGLRLLVVYRYGFETISCLQTWVWDYQLFTDMGLRLSVVYRYGSDTISCLQIWVWDYQFKTY